MGCLDLIFVSTMNFTTKSIIFCSPRVNEAPLNSFQSLINLGLVQSAGRWSLASFGLLPMVFYFGDLCSKVFRTTKKFLEK